MQERRRGQQRDERQDDLQRMGLPADQAQAWLAGQGVDTDDDSARDDGAECDQPPGAPLAVWPDNWPVLQVWQRLQTQWRETTWRGLPTGGLDGLRYGAADVVIARTLRASSQAEQDRVFDQLLQMEHAAVEASHA